MQEAQKVQCLESTMLLGGHKNILISSKSRRKRDFPGNLVAKTLPPNAGGVSLTPGQGAKIPHALWPKNQNIKRKQHYNKLKTLEMVHIKKKSRRNM